MCINIKDPILDTLIWLISGGPQESAHFLSTCSGLRIIYGSTTLRKGQRRWDTWYQLILSQVTQGNKGILKLVSGSVTPLISIHLLKADLKFSCLLPKAHFPTLLKGISYSNHSEEWKPRLRWGNDDTQRFIDWMRVFLQLIRNTKILAWEKIIFLNIGLTLCI